MPCFFKYLFVFKFSRNFRERLTENFLEKSSVVISQQYPIWPVCKTLTFITKKTSDIKVWSICSWPTNFLASTKGFAGPFLCRGTR